MAALTIHQAFEMAIHRHSDNTELVQSFQCFKEWHRKFEGSPTCTAPSCLQNRLSELPGVRRELLNTFSTISFLLEQIYYSSHGGDLDDRYTLPQDSDDIGANQVDGQVALVQKSVDTLYNISNLADEIDAEKDYTLAIWSDFQPWECDFDIAYVVDRYTQSRADDWLLNRLGSAISHRRCYLRYRDFQAEHSQHARAALALFPDLPEELKCFESSDADGDLDAGVAKSIPLLEHIKSGNGQLECPCCRQIFEFKSENAWRRHFLADLRPYVCTFEDCSMRLFASKSAWMDHEIEHRREWPCSLCPEAEGESHSIICHSLDKKCKDTEDDVPLYELVDCQSTSKENLSRADCLLCDWTKRNVSTRVALEHLAIHLEEMAIYAHDTKHLMAPSIPTNDTFEGVRTLMPKAPSSVLNILVSAIVGTFSANLAFTKVTKPESSVQMKTTHQQGQSCQAQKSLSEDQEFQDLWPQRQTAAPQVDSQSDKSCDIAAERILERSVPRKRAAISASARYQDGSPTHGTGLGFVCPLVIYGCISGFTSKDHWKTHVVTGHMCFGFWQCDMCDNSRRPNNFRSRDLFVLHLRQMHLANRELSMKSRKPSDHDTDEQYLRNATQRCYQVLRSLPDHCRCIFCDETFHGEGAWRKRMNHIWCHMEEQQAKGRKTVDLREWGVDEMVEQWMIEQRLLVTNDDGRLEFAH